VGKSANDLHAALPGSGSRKIPEGFDKPQFYPAPWVAVQRLLRLLTPRYHKAGAHSRQPGTSGK
jgi:hypothetical protein